MFQDTTSLEAMADALSRSDHYRVLRRVMPRLPSSPLPGPDIRTAVLLDTETTGLDARRDEIIELGMVKFDYWPDGRIACVRDTFSGFIEPSAPIPAEVTALTGITDAMVAGQKIDDGAVTAFAEDAAIVIAHNSGFDRKFAERYWPVFEHKAWGCSATEIDWRKHGFAGAQLGYLLNGAGYFHAAHRAVDDCHALLEVLAFELPTTGAPALGLLLETARRPTVRVWAEQSPFELKDTLKKRGYRWNDGSEGHPKSLVHQCLQERARCRTHVSEVGNLPPRDRTPHADADGVHTFLSQSLTPTYSRSTSVAFAYSVSPLAKE